MKNKPKHKEYWRLKRHYNTGKLHSEGYKIRFIPSRRYPFPLMSCRAGLEYRDLPKKRKKYFPIWHSLFKFNHKTYFVPEPCYLFIRKKRIGRYGFGFTENKSFRPK
jgi:hypothetical protein